MVERPPLVRTWLNQGWSFTKIATWDSIFRLVLPAKPVVGAVYVPLPLPTLTVLFMPITRKPHHRTYIVINRFGELPSRTHLNFSKFTGTSPFLKTTNILSSATRTGHVSVPPLPKTSKNCFWPPQFAMNIFWMYQYPPRAHRQAWWFCAVHQGWVLPSSWFLTSLECLHPRRGQFQFVMPAQPAPGECYHADVVYLNPLIWKKERSMEFSLRKQHERVQMCEIWHTKGS